MGVPESALCEDEMEKAFKLPSSEILPLAPARAACFASDMITVHGRPVGYMYRGTPDFEIDMAGASWPVTRRKST